METAPLGIVAAGVGLGAYLGYVLLAGMGTFWALVWPEGTVVRRLRWVAVVGVALIGLSATAELLIAASQGRLPPGGTFADGAGTWPLLRLGAVAAMGGLGPWLLRRPALGWRRFSALALVVVLTVAAFADRPASASRQPPAVLAIMGAQSVALAALLGGLIAVAAVLLPRRRPGGLEVVWTRYPWFAGLSALVVAATEVAEHVIGGGTGGSRPVLRWLGEALVLAAIVLLSRYAVAFGRRLAFRQRFLPARPAETRGERARLGRAIGLQTIMCVALLGIAAAHPAVLPLPGARRIAAAPVSNRPDVSPRESAVPRPVATAGEARLAASDTPRFVPRQINLPGGTFAGVVPVATVDGVLVIPEDGAKVGWWDGSSYVGDPYGSTVLAGHVDTLDGGLGFFFRLWNIRVGERVVLSAGDTRQAYTITSLRQVPRTDLVDYREIFDIAGPPRLVLITCAGEFRPDRGGYRDNLIVVARPAS